MSLVTDTVTPRSKKGTTISFDDATTYKRDSVTLLPPNLSLNQGMIKGYCTNFAQMIIVYKEHSISLVLLMCKLV